MKNIFSFLFLILVLTSCHSTKESTAKSGKNINQIIHRGDDVLLLGEINRSGLKSENFDWFPSGYSSYNPKPEVIKELKPLMKDIKIVAFMGTWCEDSHRDVPDFYKVLDAVDFDEKNLTIYAVDENKVTPQNFEEGKDLMQVPTFIFYKAGKEVGRIVEYSLRTIEEDMLDILSGKDYKHPYSDF